MANTTTTKLSLTTIIHESDTSAITITTTDSVTSPVTCDTSITTIMGSVIGVLVALQVGTLITLCVVVVYWKHSVKSKQRCIWMINNNASLARLSIQCHACKWH